MSKYGFKQERNINGGKYYWELQEWVNKLFLTYNKCPICSSQKNLEPHHIIQVKPYDKLYSSTKNGIILCKHCHNKYHNTYGYNINAGTLLKFALQEFKDNESKTIQSLERKLKQSNKALDYYKNETYKLREELDKEDF